MRPSHEVAAVVQHVLERCGAWRRLHDLADQIEDEDGRAGILSLLRSDACRAAAQAAAALDRAPAATVNVTLRVVVLRSSEGSAHRGGRYGESAHSGASGRDTVQA